MAEETTNAPTADPEPLDAPIELLPEPAQKPKSEPKPDGDDGKKQENATAYQLRKEKEQNALLAADLAKYKKRDEDERQAKQTAEEKRDEELTTLREERDKLKRDNLIKEIGIDAKLPKSMWGRIQGADEEAMRRDAEELASLVKRPAVGSATDPVRDGGGKPRLITRDELRENPKMAREAAAKLRSGEWKMAGT